MAVLIWIVLALAVHAVLWQGYQPQPEDSLIFLVVDGAVALAILGALSWAWERIKGWTK